MVVFGFPEVGGLDDLGDDGLAEVMLRLATPGHLRLNQTPVLEMTFGGGEANVAVSLALFGDEAAFVTRLPKNDIAEACIQRLRGLGVDTRHILRGGERIGIYFLESGASQRASTVTYEMCIRDSPLSVFSRFTKP